MAETWEETPSSAWVGNQTGHSVSKPQENSPSETATNDQTPEEPDGGGSVQSGNTYGSTTPVPTGLLDGPKRGLFSGKRNLIRENEELRQALSAIGVAERDQLQREIALLRAEETRIKTELEQVKHELVETNEVAILQEVGVYEYHHPLDDSVAYKGELARIKDEIKTAVRDGDAVYGATSWTVNGSTRAGAKMVREFSKLMLRAYNNEADNAVRSMKPYALASAISRLDKTKATIVKLGGTMSISITDSYHNLRIRELELTADYLAKVAEEKEREREERTRLREEEKAQREFEQEHARLEKEKRHYETVLETLKARHADEQEVSEVQGKLAEIQEAIEGIDYRAANIRAGYVYVISNIGSFGERVIKIGMTRRLEPMDRVRELSDASVPFNFDVHALIFSDDAVGLEGRLHQELADQRVNLVNNRREFFYATVHDVKDLLVKFQGNLLSFTDEPEAAQWHQSNNTRQASVQDSDAIITS